MGHPAPTQGKLSSLANSVSEVKKTSHIQAVCRSSSSVTQIEDVPPESGVASISDDISTLFNMETDDVQSGHADTTFPHMEWVNDRFVTSEDTSSMISIIYPDSENIPPIPHMEWSEGKFVPCSPKKPRRIYLNVKPLNESHSDVGLNLKIRWKNVRSGSVQCLADTGPLTCVSDTSVLNTLGISVDSLLPTRHKLISATKNQLAVNGVIMVKFENGSHSSNQLLYICDISGLYLSGKAQIDLKMIPPSYPFCDTSQETSQVSHIEDPLPPTGSPYNNLASPCGCPLRQDSPLMPQELPYPPTNENRVKLEQWLLSHFASSAFNTCEHQTLPEMTGQPLNAHFCPDAQGKVFHTPILVPHHWKSAVKSDLDRDVQLGTIEPVPQGVPTKWCARMVVVPKKDGTPRRTVDLQHLNIATYRETHHMASPFDQASVIPPHTKKTILDAWNGYHSLPVDNLSKEATTFITEWGRYSYRRAPQGFHAPGDAYNRRFDDITMDIPRKTKMVDDSLLWDNSIEDAFWHTLE